MSKILNPANVSVTSGVVITASPQSQGVCVGGNVTLNVGVSGSVLGYQWRKGGLDWSSPAVDRALSLGAQPEPGIRPAPTSTGTEASDPSKETAGAR